MQTDFTTYLKQQAVEALHAAYPQLSLTPAELMLEPTNPDHEGHYTLLVFPLLKHKLGAPEAVGREIGSRLQAMGVVEGFNVVKGFLNLTLPQTLLSSRLVYVHTNAEAFLHPQIGQGRKVMVEYSSPNTNKPLHLGHLRNNFLGYSVAQILEAVGYNVAKANLINDRGIHICKSMAAWKLYANGETPESTGEKGDHFVGRYYVRYNTELGKAADVLVTRWKTALAAKDHSITEGCAPESARKLEHLLATYTGDTPELTEALLEIAKVEADIYKLAQRMLREWEQGDTETVHIWRTMNDWCIAGLEQTYRTIGVSFDKYYFESNTYLLGKDIVEEGLQKGVFFRKPDGSVWIDLTAEGLDEKLVLRSDGTSVYMTQDMGTADLKFQDYGIEKSIYVIANEQDYHMKVLIHILHKLGRSYAPGMYHLSYGMVDLPTGRMKSREGTVVDADDIVNEMTAVAAAETEAAGKAADMAPEEQARLHREIGLGALKYYLLRIDPAKRMLFNPEESISLQGHTGPFIQYTHARIHSLLAKAETQGYQPAADLSGSFQLEPTESDLIVLLDRFPLTLSAAGEKYNPSLLANYLYELAKSYNRFYYEVPILKPEQPEMLRFRLALSRAVQQTLAFGLGLLGIAAPNRM